MQTDYRLTWWPCHTYYTVWHFLPQLSCVSLWSHPLNDISFVFDVFLSLGLCVYCDNVPEVTRVCFYRFYFGRKDREKEVASCRQTGAPSLIHL